ncbi:MAG: RNA polymerase sigma factor [Bacteroidia bacterium]|nr:RNA polymerase sigma factor [Bacteroidia bacterium]
MEESDIIKGCVRNDRLSQKALYERFYGKMISVCLRYAKDRDEAQDMLHEGFMKVFGNIKNFGSKGSFEGWVRRIMVNCCIDHLRKNKQQYLIVNTVIAESAARTSPDEVSDEELADLISKEEVMKAVQNLSPAYRTIFNLYVIEEYTHREISEMLDISEGTSKSNLAKAKFNLKKNLTQLLKVRQ